MFKFWKAGEKDISSPVMELAEEFKNINNWYISAQYPLSKVIRHRTKDIRFEVGHSFRGEFCIFKCKWMTIDENKYLSNHIWSCLNKLKDKDNMDERKRITKLLENK